MGNKERVESYITKAFSMKEISYLSSVYFLDEHNGNASTNNTTWMMILLSVTLKNLMEGHNRTQEERMYVCCTCISIWKKWNGIS